MSLSFMTFIAFSFSTHTTNKLCLNRHPTTNQLLGPESSGLRRHRRPYVVACPMRWCTMSPTAADGYEYASDLGASLSGRLAGLRYRHHLVDMGLGTVPICDSRRFRELSLSLRGVQDSFHMRRRAPLDVLRDPCTVLAAMNGARDEALELAVFR